MDYAFVLIVWGCLVVYAYLCAHERGWWGVPCLFIAVLVITIYLLRRRVDYYEELPPPTVLYGDNEVKSDDVENNQ